MKSLLSVLLFAAVVAFLGAPPAKASTNAGATNITITVTNKMPKEVDSKAGVQYGTGAFGWNGATPIVQPTIAAAPTNTLSTTFQVVDVNGTTQTVVSAASTNQLNAVITLTTSIRTILKNYGLVK